MDDFQKKLLGGFEVPKMPDIDMSHIHRVNEDARLRNNPVLQIFESLQQYVQEFESTLEADQEVGARLVSFGNTVTFHIRQIGYSKPNIITFDGVTDDGNRVKLVQHVSQLSVLLISMKVKSDTPKTPIGFVRLTAPICRKTGLNRGLEQYNILSL